MAAVDPGRAYLQGVYNAAHPTNPIDSSGLTGVSAAAAAYPAFASLMAIPEVAEMLNQAAREGWTSDQFTVHLMTTNWWKTKSDTERVWEATKLSDPAKAAQEKQQMFQRVATESQLLGVALDTNQLNFITEGAIAGGWDANVLKSAIAGNAQANKERPGQIAATQTALNGIAEQYGIPISPQTTFSWAQHITQGTADQASFQEYAKQQAKISHPYWEKQLDQGITVRQLADPYIQQAAKLLEISPDSIDLSSHQWSNAFAQPDKAGAVKPMAMLDWQTHLMTNPTYGYDRTDNARQAAFGMVDQLSKTMGAKA